MQAREQSLEEIIRTLLGFFAIPENEAAIHTDEADGRLIVSINVPDGKMLIGKGGQNLKSLEHILRLLYARQNPDRARGMILDVNSYRKELREELSVHARTVAQRVRETKTPEALRPMTAYERRIIHAELSMYTDVASESIGQDPHRRVIIRPA